MSEYTARWHVGEYMSGWMVDYSLVDTGIARFMSGWGTVIHESVAKALNAGAHAEPRAGDTFTFADEDVDRVVALMREAQARRAAKRPETVRCDCGHTVARNMVMSASLGTSCPDCYDRMSD